MNLTRQRLAGLLLLAAATPAGAQNLFVNHSFETGDLTGWDSCTYNAVLSTDTTPFGSFSAKRQNFAAHSFCQNVPVTLASDICEASVWTTHDLSVFIVHNAPGGGLHSTTTNYNVTNGSWNKVDYMDAVSGLPLGHTIKQVGFSFTGNVLGRIDEAVFRKKYLWDNGQLTNWWGGGVGEHAWLQGYEAPIPDVIRTIETTYGDVSDGLPVRIGLWNDPTNDFDPSDAVLLWSMDTVTTHSGGSNAMNTYAVDPPIQVSGVFFVGAVCDHPGEYPAPMDQTSASNGHAWLGFSDSGYDMSNLSNNFLAEMDANGWPTVWRIRACGGGEANQPTAYCDPGGTNSVSFDGAVLTSVSNYGTLHSEFLVTDIPDQPGILFAGPNQITVSFGCGQRCVGGQIVRFDPIVGSNGQASAVIDMTAPFLNNIQFWYRDPANLGLCGSTFNLSNALGQ